MDSFPEAGGLAAAVREIAEGHDLRPRLSTSIDYAYTLEPPTALARRKSRGRHYDGLLADWGIHHLHLGVTPHPHQRGFIRRTGHVLFAAFQPSDAFLVDLQPHESDGANWSALRILEIIARNWPDARILVPTLSGTRLKGGNWLDDERRQMRHAGIAGGAVEIDGAVWVAGGGGQSLGGAPMPVVQHCMAVSWLLSGYEPTETDLHYQLQRMAVEHQVPGGPWQAHVDGENFGFVSGGLFVPYGSLLPDGIAARATIASSDRAPRPSRGNASRCGVLRDGCSPRRRTPPTAGTACAEPARSRLVSSCRVSGEQFLYPFKGGSLRSPPAPAAGGRKRPSSPAP